MSSDRGTARRRPRADPRSLSGRVRLRRTRWRAGVLGALRRGRQTALLLADVVDRPLAQLEGADSLSRAPLPGARRSTAAATGGRTARRRRAHTDRGEFAADALAVMDATGTERATLVVASRGAADRPLLLAADHPERVDAAGVHRAGRCRCRQPRRAAPRDAVRRAARRPTRAGRSGTATTGCGTTAEFVEFFFVAGASPSRTRPSSSRTRSAGRSTTDAETLVATAARRRDCPTRQSVRELADRVRCPVLVIHGDRRRRPPP